VYSTYRAVGGVAVKRAILARHRKATVVVFAVPRQVVRTVDVLHLCR